MFFSHKKLTNNTFDHELPVKRTINNFLYRYGESTVEEHASCMTMNELNEALNVGKSSLF